MRRILLVLTVALVRVAMMVAMALPAFADASGKASCQGQDLSTIASRFHGVVGEEFGRDAPEARQRVGDTQSSRAKDQPRNACLTTDFRS